MDDYRSFYLKHKNGLFAYLMRMTGEYFLSSDIMQESFTKYLEHYGPHQGNAALLYTIERNTLLDSFRKQKKLAPMDEQTVDCNENQEHACMIRDEYRRVIRCMQRLPTDERDILALVVSGDLSYREIAGLVGTSEGNIKVKVHRTRLKLRNMMQSEPSPGLGIG